MSTLYDVLALVDFLPIESLDKCEHPLVDSLLLQNTLASFPIWTV